MPNLTLFVELEAVRRNLIRLREIYGTGLLFMVKSNAYGHGIREVSVCAEPLVDYFGTATAEEGVILRRTGIKKPILVSVFKEKEAALLAKYSLTATLTGLSQAEALARGAGLSGKTADAHIKIDSGMNRLGVKSAKEFSDLARYAEASKSIRLCGCHTHIFDASDTGAVDKQLQFFHEITDGTAEKYASSGREFIRHMSGSFPALTRQDLRFDMVRAGLAAYGGAVPHSEESAAYEKIIIGAGETKTKAGLAAYGGLEKSSTEAGSNATNGGAVPECGESAHSVVTTFIPALSAVAEVIASKRGRAGENAGYGNNVLSRDTNIAIVSAGYGDGVSRRFAGGDVKIRGQRCRILGVPCMDVLLADTGGFLASPGETAVVLDDELSAEYWAELSGTVPYEILCGFHNRVKYIYLS
ncbi:MAG: alanine racemase [Clostridiaceae bacterium]|jgi:alanine racemase|nr:alanine racemase [Clostridiaceae bacterium]